MIHSGIEDYKFNEDYDFIFLMHSLYYVDDLKKIIKKILLHGSEICLVHHGKLGMYEIQQKFHRLIRKGPNIFSSYFDIQKILDELNLENFNLDYKIFNSKCKVDISECKKKDSKEGHKLISFFLERDYSSLSKKDKEIVHKFFKNSLGKELIHDEGIILIKNLDKKC